MTTRAAAPDVQSSRPTVHLSLSRVGVTGVEKVIRLNHGGQEQLFSARLEDEVQILGHAAAVVDSPVCLRYASMNGSIAPSITFCTSGILSSVR